MYLDEFIVEIENLPSELQDMLTNIRELDLVVQNAIDEKNKQAYVFFQNAQSMKPKKRDLMFQSLLLEFGRILEAADEKVNVAEQLHSLLVERLEQLDQELAQFKNELENEKPRVTRTINDKVMPDSPVNHKSRNDKLRKVKKFKIYKKKKSTILSSISRIREIKRSNIYELDKDKSVSLNRVVADDADLDDDLIRYCICNKLSYGNMVACDNEFCPYEWFHYACVNMTTAPEGKWYCPKCMVCEVSLERHYK